MDAVSLISHFANENNIGCLPQHRANNPREIQPDLVIDLHLIDALQVVLDRILSGDDLSIRPIKGAHRCIKRCGLSRTGRAGHKNNSVGALDQLVEFLEILFTKPELTNPNFDVGPDLVDA